MSVDGSSKDASPGGNEATLQFSSLGMLTPVEFGTRNQPTT
jgi:hypothetical protein